jgi:signal transduction histidine kinase/uncharacterized protein YoaH (UPF0181 family)
MITTADPLERRPASERGRLAEQQAGLRRVATLAAGGASAQDVFDAVAREVAEVLYLTNAAVCRYDEDGTSMTVLSVFGDRPEVFEPGSRWPLDGPSMSAEVLRTGRPARVEDYTELPGSLAAAGRGGGFNQVVGSPITVDGHVWGVISTASPNVALPDDLEERLAEFTELVGMAIANSQAHEEIARLADEQAALRRVATLVAQGASPAEVFEAVSNEVTRLVDADGAALTRYEADGTVTGLGGWTTSGGYTYVGKNYPPEGTVSGLIFKTRRPARVDNYATAPGLAPFAAREMGWRSSVGAPITVEGRLWGALAVASKDDEPLPPDTERRLVEFTEIVATAIANAESRQELTLLAEEQAALRRVATLVAEGAPPDKVFATVSREVARILGVPIAEMVRFDPDGTRTVVASAGVGFGEAGNQTPELTPARGIRWRIGVPIVVEGALWGAMNAGSRDSEPPNKQTELRLAKFTELLATAIANAESRAELGASRARIVATADATRRRIERDLHDGAYDKLISLALRVRAAQAAAPAELTKHRADLARIAEGMTSALEGLREIALGLHPAILSEGGLSPALKRLAYRCPIPAALDVRVEGRLPERVEVAAYYVVSEALTNAAKHAEASKVHVAVEKRGSTLRVAIRDNGLGGADPSRGSGLVGLKDRAEAIGGTLSVASPPGAGTSLLVELPLGEHAQ